ncbi:hypothetical protein GE061_007747 [Apolygus lucorum]|uniref:Uncharacterized protein n=1 Tax=Apolygus lucorum TaxID=248454 RepID=A0A8S9WM87_APOLU|nr:hypothetical protein GE061_007747 [Apolygus lucorum]
MNDKIVTGVSSRNPVVKSSGVVVLTRNDIEKLQSVSFIRLTPVTINQDRLHPYLVPNSFFRFKSYNSDYC